PAERGPHREHERGPHRPGAGDRDRARQAPPEEQVEEHAERRERDDPAETGRLDHHLRVASSSALVVSRFRNIERMIASPTAASAAATVITKKTITCPSIEPRLRASATKVRLTAFSMSSIAMKMTMTLRRTSTPMAPIANSTALSPRYQVRGAVGGTSGPPLGEPD